MNRMWLQVSLALVVTCVSLSAEDVPATKVRNRSDLMKALKDAKPGTRILLAPGRYKGGMYLKGVKGTKEKPIVVAAADPKDPPVIEGGYCSFQFSGAEYLELRNIVCVGGRGNGINIDGG
ncbi:MAG: chondroitinase-B domain-containing protein, partial [Planctomycetota bacterium]|nr:chondroitinase-B domain-containing protein [Planctomycetota bacterium]